MTSEEKWTSIRVTKIDRELSHEEQRLPSLKHDVMECEGRIDRLKKDREAELKHEAREAV